ncbi:MAG: hypothetical protein JW807_13215 [Spirochaetes bacterium]|nr:hypothetical protein [Spirochaetota bacterium]
MSDDDIFKVMDCALISISTGEQAQNLRELLYLLKAIHPGCIYYHFWGGLLRPRFDDPEFQNDFAIWSWRYLHDRKLAEQLSLIDPADYTDIEELRREVIEVIEMHLSESEIIPWAKTGDQFYFIRSQIVTFDTGIRVHRPEEMVELIPRLSLGSIFYHFIDARRRTTEGKNDFSLWLAGPGGEYDSLLRDLDEIDPYFTMLSDLRSKIGEIFSNHFPDTEVRA